MFTKKVNPSTEIEKVSRERRRRGRPAGTTRQGQEMRERLYLAAIRLITERGYAATTLRDVADAAEVSVGLLYKYFPNKRAVVIELYDRLSAKYAARAAEARPGKWRDRFLFAMRTCLEVLGPHRNTLAALVPVLVGDPDEGIFAPSNANSHLRVEKIFQDVVKDATDAPTSKMATALGRLLYLLHLTVILWWLLDRSPEQRATDGLIALLQRILPSAAFALRFPPFPAFVISGDALVRDALTGDWGEGN
jgi:AcrR family transcriptional regulator